MTIRFTADGDATTGSRLSRATKRWLRKLRRGRDMRRKEHRAFVTRAMQLVKELDQEPSVAQRDLILRYCHLIEKIERVEAEGDATADLAALLRISERLMSQAKALGSLPPPAAAPVPEEPAGLAASFAAAMRGAMRAPPAPPSPPEPPPLRLLTPPPEREPPDPEVLPADATPPRGLRDVTPAPPSRQIVDARVHDASHTGPVARPSIETDPASPWFRRQ